MRAWNIRPVGETYRQLIANWRDVLPTQSLCLTVPLQRPGEGFGRAAHALDKGKGRPKTLREGEPLLQPG